MGLIESSSYKIASKIGEKASKTKEEINVMNYGLFMIMHTSIAIILTIILGFLIGKPVEMLLITFTSASLKRYSGGVHATSANRCLIIGLIVSTILTYTASILSNYYSKFSILLFSIIIFSIAYLIFYKEAPVGTKNKPLKNKDKRKKLRKSLFYMLNMYFAITLILITFIIIGRINVEYIKFVYCIELGIILQATALTKFGEYIILNLDNVLIHINYKGD